MEMREVRGNKADATRNAAMRNPNTCDAGYLPKDDAFCVMDLLKMLAEADDTGYVYQSNYNRIGLKTKEEVNYFKRDEGMVVTPFKDLVLNKEKVNVSIRSKIAGKVQLNPNQAERVGLNPVIDSYTYRTQTIIKNGFLNMDTIQFVVTPETLEKLEAIKELKILSVEPFASTDLTLKKLVTLDLTSLPVINKKYVDQSMSMHDILVNTVEALKLEAQQKMANYVLKTAREELGEEKGIFVKLTDEQVELLKDYGLNADLSYVGVGVKQEEKGEDFYEARKISYAIKGCASLPSGADVLKKMASGKLNKAGELMADWYKGLQAFLASQTFASREEELRATIGYAEKELVAIKKALFANRLQTCILNMAIVLTDYWFEGVDTDDKGNMTYTEGDTTLVIKAVREKVYY